MSNCNSCNPCPPALPALPGFCEPLAVTSQAKKIVVEDNASCQATIQTPAAPAVVATNSSGNISWKQGSNSTLLGVKNNQVEFIDGSSTNAFELPLLQANTATNDPRIVTQQTDGTIRHWRPSSSTATPRLVYDKNNQWEIDTLNNLLPSGNGTVFIRDNAGALQAVTGNSGDILQIVGSAPTFVTSGASAPFPAGHLYGMILSNNSASPTKGIDVTNGECRSYSATENIILSSPITKTCDGVFVAGTGQPGNLGGVPNPSTATTLHVFVIQGASGTEIAFYNLPNPSAVLPSGYDQAWRRIGSIVTDSSGNIRGFSQNGDRFLYVNPVLQYPGATPTTVRGTSIATGGTAITLTVPIGLKVAPIIRGVVASSASTRYWSFYDLDQTFIPPLTPDSTPNATQYIPSASSTSSFINFSSNNDYILTNTLAQVGVDTNSAITNQFAVDVWGWIDSRNRLQP